jgi:hypothetical protein
MKQYGYIPLRRHKFIAVEKATGRPALIGGVCRQIRYKLASTGRCEYVEAVDWNNQDRTFYGSKWRFLERK